MGVVPEESKPGSFPKPRYRLDYIHIPPTLIVVTRYYPDHKSTSHHETPLPFLYVRVGPISPYVVEYAPRHGYCSKNRCNTDQQTEPYLLTTRSRWEAKQEIHLSAVRRRVLTVWCQRPSSFEFQYRSAYHENYYSNFFTDFILRSGSTERIQWVISSDQQKTFRNSAVSDTNYSA